MVSLVVALNPPSSAAGAELSYALTANGETLSDHGVALPNLLPRADDVVAVVPVRQLSWHRPMLPRVPANRLRAALEGQLEESLLDDPELFHFAVQPGARALMDGNAEVWVVACDRAWLRASLKTLEDAGRRVRRIVPEFTPGAPLCWITGTPSDAWCVVTDPNSVTVWPLAVLRSKPADIDIFAEPAVAAVAEQTLRSKVLVRQQAERLVAAARSDWDLAQFEFATQGRAQWLKPVERGWQHMLHAPDWRPARHGVVALLLVQLVALNAWAWKERSALDARRLEARALLTQTFPQVTTVLDAPVQMAREFSQLQQAAGTLSAADFETLLQQLSQASGGRSVTQIEFSGSELSLRIPNLGAAEFAQIETQLGPAGYRLRNADDRITLSLASTPARP